MRKYSLVEKNTKTTRMWIILDCCEKPAARDRVPQVNSALKGLWAQISAENPQIWDCVQKHATVFPLQEA